MRFPGVEFAARPKLITLLGMAEEIVDPSKNVIGQLSGDECRGLEHRIFWRSFAASPEDFFRLQEKQVLIVAHIREHLSGRLVRLARACERLNRIAGVEDSFALRFGLRNQSLVR